MENHQTKIINRKIDVLQEDLESVGLDLVQKDLDKLGPPKLAKRRGDSHNLPLVLSQL